MGIGVFGCIKVTSSGVTSMIRLTVILSLIVCSVAQQRRDVCTQVQLMSQYCSSQGGNETGRVATVDILEERMREIESELRRTLGAPPPVNYSFVEEVLSARFKGVEERVIARLGKPPVVNYSAIEEDISTRFQRLEALVNSDEGLVDYSRIFNSVDERFSAIRSYVDAKFARLVNDTEAYKRAVESQNRQMNISDCRQIRLEDAKLCNATGGVFDIYRGMKRYEVFCDSYTDGGGWTVFQRRMDGSLNFNRTWNEYVNGFGERHREFWLGLQNIHELLQGGTHELRIDLMDSSGRVRFAKYQIFYVAGKSRDYNLLLQSFSGDIGDRLASGRPFSTIDRDRDSWSRNCAETRLGGWWFTNCGNSWLNGNYDSTNLYWYGFPNLVRSEMKFRRLVD